MLTIINQAVLSIYSDTV